MRLHEPNRSGLVIGAASLGLAVAWSALLGSSRSVAAGGCGASAGDMYGTFVAHRTPPASAPDHDDEELLTVTFNSPNRVTDDYEATRPGHTDASLRGSGTFSISPLTWTEKGTRTAGGKSEPYELTFKASKVDCAGGTRVTGFTGTFSSPAMAITDTESFLRR
jgi:hypothetical protein